MDRGIFGPQNGIVVEHHGGGPSAFAWTIFALLCALLLVALISLVLDSYYRSNRNSDGGGNLTVLDERYARGETARAAYLQARADRGGAPPAGEATTEIKPSPSGRRRTNPPAPAT